MKKRKIAVVVQERERSKRDGMICKKSEKGDLNVGFDHWIAPG